MAWIDKIRADKEQGKELLMFLKKHRRRIFSKTGYKFPTNHYIRIDDRYSFSFPTSIDVYLARKCRIPFVCKRLSQQYGDTYTGHWLKGYSYRNWTQQGKYWEYYGSYFRNVNYYKGENKYDID